MELTFVAALTIGFLGSTHCLGMCGGIVSALNARLPQTQRPSHILRMAHHITYNAGRILSYVVAGGLAGLAGAQAQRLSPGDILPVGSLIAGLFLIALGLYLAGWWRAIAGLEHIGMHVWRWIKPLGRRFLPVQNPLHAFGLGLVWGWLPCGLVYSALALAVISASPERGAWLMLGFGLGTLPMLLVMGRASEYLGKIMRSPAIRQMAGALVILFGVYTLLIAFSGHEHQLSSSHAAAAPDNALSSAQTAFSLIFSKICLTQGGGID